MTETWDATTSNRRGSQISFRDRGFNADERTEMNPEGGRRPEERKPRLFFKDGVLRVKRYVPEPDTEPPFRGYQDDPVDGVKYLEKIEQ